VKPNLRGEDKNISVEHSRNSPGGIAEQQLLSSSDGNGLIHQPTIHQRCAQHAHEVFNGKRTDRFLPKSNSGENGQGVKRATQVVEHVVAVSVYHSCLENCVRDAGVADEFFGCPLRFVIGRSTIRARSQETEQHDLANTASPSRLYDIGRALDMETLVSLRAQFAIDAGQVGNGVASCESKFQS